jgi:hypothetical protein
LKARGGEKREHAGEKYRITGVNIELVSGLWFRSAAKALRRAGWLVFGFWFLVLKP